MDNRPRLGVAMCGSFCTFETVFEQLPRLAAQYDIIPIMSGNAAGTDTRFGDAQRHIKRLMDICGRRVITEITEAEPLGTSQALDALLIAPCTGNTLAKLSNGITDTAVTMAAKAHLRNGRPLILAISTNDGLSGSGENIARLLNRKNVYFVPFRQDDPVKKPFSLQADFGIMADAVAAALRNIQLQPVIIR